MTTSNRKSDRRRFLQLLGMGLASVAAGIGMPHCHGRNKKRNMVFGWTTCLTYQTGDRRLGYDYYSRLLDEMDQHGMTRLIVMMASHGAYSPENHGLAWPARNPLLKPQIDPRALNSCEETEFFSQIIKKAHHLGIKIYIEIKYLGMRGIRRGYPGVEFLTPPQGGFIHQIDPAADPLEREAIETLHICCDSEPAQRYMRDKIRDVLERYSDLDGLVLEHPSYTENTCWCRSSQQRLLQDTGKTRDNISPEELHLWKSTRVRDTLIDLKKLIKSINPNFEFGFYTGLPTSEFDIADYQNFRGHRTELLAQVGCDFVMPYCEGRNGDKEPEMVEKVIDHLAPLKFYLHTTIRKEMPQGYALPPKDARYVKNIIAWGKECFARNDRFIGMTFFNEVKLPEENRQAVYESINSKDSSHALSANRSS
ncbi:MAG TPA: hypothetical protein PKN04_12565 [bacterium]|nr:hypothetical protein [bacterium]HNT66606.1 hypothetical protein [bacterium]HOX86687.1 hypothetical protein [bacterium]HPM98249.1 hypothetical protein [bacterium]